jgi:hypothetical protein
MWKKITGNHCSLKLKTLTLDFHSGYDRFPNCMVIWEGLDLEDQSDIIQKIKT